MKKVLSVLCTAALCLNLFYQPYVARGQSVTEGNEFVTYKIEEHKKSNLADTKQDLSKTRRMLRYIFQCFAAVTLLSLAFLGGYNIGLNKDKIPDKIPEKTPKDYCRSFIKKALKLGESNAIETINTKLGNSSYEQGFKDASKLLSEVCSSYTLEGILELLKTTKDGNDVVAEFCKSSDINIYLPVDKVKEICYLDKT